MSEQDDGLFDLDGHRDPVASPPDEGPRGGRRPLLAIGLGAAVVVTAVAVVISTATAAPSPPVAAGTTTPTTTPTTSSAPASATPAAPVTEEPPAPETTPTVYADPAALADLSAVAATLTTPLTLTSPATWDQWLPQGKPYPGRDTADDLSTCPVLAGRLGAALGTKMSYWVGTLPGPGGCTWATVPLKSGPDAPNYPYLANVDFTDDGSTPEKASTSFLHHQGRRCPRVAVPAAGQGAYLVRCEDLEGITYIVVTRDTRTAGIWSLSGSARSDATHSARDVFRAVVAGTVRAYT